MWVGADVPSLSMSPSVSTRSTSLEVSSAEETSKDVLRVLTEGDMLNDGTSAPTHIFESTGDPDTFDALARRFLAPPVHAVGRDLRIH